MIKRVIKSLINQKSKTLLILSIMCILFMVLLLSNLMKNYSSTILSKISSIPDIKVELSSDFDANRNYNVVQPHNLNGEYINNYDEWKEIYEIYLNDYEELANKEYVKYSDLNLLDTSFSNLELVPYGNGLLYDCITENDGSTSELTNYNDEYNFFLNRMNQNSAYFATVSKDDYSFKHNDNLKEFLEGRDFTEDEIANGEFKIILDGRYAKYNGIDKIYVEIGDTFYVSVLNNIHTDNLDNRKSEIIKTYEFEVIGFAVIDDPFIKSYIMDDGEIATRENSYNLIPLKAFESIYEECLPLIEDEEYSITRYYDSPISFYPIIFELNSLDDLEVFANDINELNLQGRTYTFKTNVDKYIELAGNIEGINETFNMLFIFSLIASLLIFFFLVLMDVSNRKKEIGILTSLGETRINICIQMILEYLIIVVIAFIVSLIVTAIISNKLAYVLLDLNTIGNLNNILETDATINGNVSISIKDIFTTFIYVILITIPSIIMSILYILHFNPKEILNNE